MKNHIKNYIKIMGLATVPFGTAQAADYEIKVTQESKPDAEHFKIAIREGGKKPRVADIVWSHDKEYPNPIFESNGFIRHYSDETKREARYLFGLSLVDNVRMFSAIPLDKWRNFYDVKSFSDGQLREIAKEFDSTQVYDAVFQGYVVEFLKNKNITLDNFLQR